MRIFGSPVDGDALRSRWESCWEAALAAWSRFTKLSTPRWCVRVKEEQDERLEGSFAMIRLDDHAIVISLRQIHDVHLEAFGREILAHEIGHHVYAPGDLRDNARLMARVRRALPMREMNASYVANLYTDLLINDRLQRSAGLDMAGVFRALKTGGADRLWALYMRIYERLWSLPPGTLVDFDDDETLRIDTDLGARVIRTFARDWLRGAGRFAALLLPYLPEPRKKTTKAGKTIWADTVQAGESAGIPDGLTEIDDGEDDVRHPAEDPELSGIEEAATPEEVAEGRKRIGGVKNRYREPSAYVELMKSLGVKVSPKEMVMRYYRESALPHLVPFPVRMRRLAADPVPEGLDVWDIGSPVSSIDWTGTLNASPLVVPGLTTLERTYGTTEGAEPQRTPLDLYVGIDCSGSMGNPSGNLSYPVLAGTVLALSALRAGAQVMACLSGDPGAHTETKGFVRSEREILGVMTDYLGTGYSFGIDRLAEAFPAPRSRPTHILVVSDSDLFMMLGRLKTGWDIARESVLRAGGGATAVLQLDPKIHAKPLAQLRDAGWTVHPVRNMEEVVAFARAFARARYGSEPGYPGGRT